jgi:glucokinase
LTTISLDLGGSHIAVAVVRSKTILAERSVVTNASSLTDDLPRIGRLVRECLTESEIDLGHIKGIALGYCGVVDSETGEILSTLNKYPDSQAIDLPVWAKSEFNLPLRIENDACLALLGEVTAGAARGANDVVMVTLGTGIGGAAMLEGRLLRSRAGQAGCLGGHLPVNFKGRRCACGAIGCAEAEASSAVLPLLCREHQNFSASLLAQQAMMDFKTVFHAADDGDCVAQDVIDRCFEVWSALTVGLIHAYGPELVVFGGGVLARGERVLTPIRDYVERHMWRTTRGVPRLSIAELGHRAALLGGPELFKRNVVDRMTKKKGSPRHVDL